MKIWTLSKTNTEVRNQAWEEASVSTMSQNALHLGLDGLVGKLKVDLDKGLTGADF